MRFLIAATLFAPSAAEASGGEILSLFWLEVLLLVLVAISVALGKLSRKGKLLVVGAYLLGAAMPLVLTSGWPYRNNMLLINSLCFGVPFVAWLSAFVYSRTRLGQT